MENMGALAVAGSIISAAAVFVFMQFKRYEEQQDAGKKILKATTEFESTKTKLLGYTQFTEHLAAGKAHLVQQAKPMAVNLLRDYVHLERYSKEKYKFKADVIVIGRYTVEHHFAIDLRPDSFEVVVEGAGIAIKCGQPVTTTPPAIKSATHDVSVPGVLTDERATFAEVNQKFGDLAVRYGLAIAREESVRALCKIRLADSLRDFLTKQPGVRQIPTIVVVFK